MENLETDKIDKKTMKATKMNDTARIRIQTNDKEDYFMTYKTFTKGKWLGINLIDILAENFSNRTREYFIEAIELGVIKVNDENTVPSYKMQNNDYFTHLAHQHEPKQPNVEVLHKSDDIWVVNKPPGIPCHPVGPYHFYTVTKTVFGNKNVGCVNRLDMPVSGVLILNVCGKNAVHKHLNDAHKVYVAKVKGRFPEKVTVNEPIGQKEGSKVQGVRKDGKPCTTHFELIETNGEYSLVKCMPITGRTHQIRVHLQYQGFPILHDILYGDGKEVEVEFKNECKTNIEDVLRTENLEDTIENRQKYEFVIRNCSGKNNRTFAIKDSFICLHAWKYTFNNETYEAKLPEWANLDIKE